jgi:hypothetical protein
MVIEEDLAAELEIELMVEPAHPFQYGGRLLLQVHFIVESPAA